MGIHFEDHSIKADMSFGVLQSNGLIFFVYTSSSRKTDGWK